MKEDIIAKLRDGIDKIKTVHIGDVTVGLKALRHNHYHEAQMTVSKAYQAEEVRVGMHNIDDFEMDKEDQYLLMTVVDVETGILIFDDVQTLRESLNKATRDSLLAEAEEWQEECSPNLSNLSEEEFDEVLEQVKKKPDQATLNELNLHTLKKLVHTLASQLKS